MEHSTNKLIRAFFALCDYAAWDKVNDLWTNVMQGWLNYHFKNLPETERYEIIPDFQVKFLKKAKTAHEEAEIEIRSSEREHTPLEIEAKRIAKCTTKTGFDLSYGSKFEDWMWKCLFHDALNKLKQIKNGSKNTFEIDKLGETFPQYEKFSQFQIPTYQGGLRSANAVKELLKKVLEGDELIYLELWFNANKPDAPPDPDASEVKTAIKNETGRMVEDDYISRLKKNFLAKSYLALIEHIAVVGSLASLFRRLSKVSHIENLMFEIMMKNIWIDFYEDEVAVHKSKTEISKALWTKWEKAKQKKAVQEEILIEAYRHYRFFRPPRRFCYLIELYADNRFGGKIRDKFMGGEE